MNTLNMSKRLNIPINFSYNWNNKLACSSFTSFRILSTKYQIGHFYDIQLHNKTLFEAKLTEMKVMKLNQVNEFIARIDTGFSKDEFIGLVKTMYKNKIQDFENVEFVLLLLVKQKHFNNE